MRDPKLIRMARALEDPDGALALHVNQHMQRDMTVTRNVTRCAACGAVLSIWGNARRNGRRVGDDLVLPELELVDLDDIAELPGAGVAMQVAGWVREVADGLIFPAFFAVHNVDPMEATRAKAAARQRRYRDRKALRNGDVTDGATVTHRVEESRVENNTKGVPPCPVDDIVDAFNETFGRQCRVTAKRQRALAVRWREDDWRANWRQALDRAGPSAFLNGHNDRGWRIDLDFFLKPDTVAKILDGNYDNRTNSTQRGGSKQDHQQFNSLSAIAEAAGIGQSTGHPVPDETAGRIQHANGRLLAESAGSVPG